MYQLFLSTEFLGLHSFQISQNAQCPATSVFDTATAEALSLIFALIIMVGQSANMSVQRSHLLITGPHINPLQEAQLSCISAVSFWALYVL